VNIGWINTLVAPESTKAIAVCELVWESNVRCLPKLVVARRYNGVGRCGNLGTSGDEGYMSKILGSSLGGDFSNSPLETIATTI